MNDLTKKLLAEGYASENHPDYVKWHYGFREFEYTIEAVKQFVWETPCGLLRKGCLQDACGNGSFNGITYRPENNNLRIGCPYYYKDRLGEYSERDCEHRDPASPCGWNCTTHRTERPYDYEQSVEKIQNTWEQIQHEVWLEATARYGYCACMEWARSKRKYVSDYHVMKCINTGCKNDICAITKRERNLEKVNIYYDILRERHYKKGLFELTDRTIEKGVKKFDRPIARSDAEIWLRVHADNFVPRKSKDDRRELHFSKYHGSTGYNDYDWCEYKVTPQNIRIERRESRDLLQDLQDIAEGIEVFHASDIVKQKKEEKRERKAERKAAKERKVIKNMQWIAAEGIDRDGEPVSDFRREWSQKQLEKRGIVLDKQEQMDLFSLEVES